MRNVLSKLRQLLSAKTDHQVQIGGATASRHIELDDATLSRHVSITGRLGRGISLYVEQQLTRQTEQGRGWIYIDATSDETLLARLAETARAQGRSDEFYVLNLNDPQNSHTYDVLRAGSPVDQAIRALQALPAYADSPGADFYIQLCFEFLVPLFAAVNATGKSVGLHELGVLLLNLESEAAQQSLLAAIPAGHAAQSSLLDALETLDGSDRNSTSRKHALSKLTGRLLTLGSEQGANVINDPHPEIEFSDILANNKMCYVMLPAMGDDSTWISLARMVLHDVSTSIQARSNMPANDRVPFLFVMDRFPAYGLASGIHAPMRSTIYSQARGQAVCMVPVMPDMQWERLRETYPADEVDGLIGNTFTKVYFNQDQGELTSSLHPNLPEAALDKLELGEYVVCSGSEVLSGAVAPPPPSRAPAPYIERKTVAGGGRERLAVSDESDGAA